VPVPIPSSYVRRICAAISHGGNDLNVCYDELKSSIKNHYITEQKSKCCYCKETIGQSSARLWDLEHVLPRSKYKIYLCEPYNLAVACTNCNGSSGKSDTDVLTPGVSISRYPHDSKAFSIPHPHFDIYEDHIKKVGFFYRPVNNSPKGIALIDICKLDRYAKKQSEIFEGLDITHLSTPAMELMQACANNDRDAMAQWAMWSAPLEALHP
jgi:hypothetical protein